ncbi:MAG: endopeptidase La [Gammaproteobacteria bacterium]|nr:endopeptidase La [Gammaproteobacteria bacterium]
MSNELDLPIPAEIPVLPLRDVVVYPHMVIPLFIGRPKSIKALEISMDESSDKRILLVSQHDPNIDDPGEKELYHFGTIASVLQLLKLPDGTLKALVEGESRVKIKRFIDQTDYISAEVTNFNQSLTELDDKEQRETEVLMRSILSLFDQYAKLSRKVPTELIGSLSNLNEPDRLADTIAAHLNLKISDKQELLEIGELKKRLNKLLSLVQNEINLLKIEKRIRGRVEQQIKKNQREYYLNEQMKAIQKELNTMEDGANEVESLRAKIDKAGMTKEAHEKALSELNKLKMMPAMSAEATVCRNYLDWLISVPWKKKSKVTINLKKAKKVLDEQHYGLEKIKERFIEYLAVQQRVAKVKGAILCLVGPPGVGKTSLGQSIAEATGRKFIRVSLGGVRDEAEIRGHRRTYIGSMPGKIIQKMAKAEVKNPLFMLDEIDKMAMDFRGDPASALLEVLDPEQNDIFSDHYLEVDYDLSSVMFIATANTLDIPPALLDRMEVIRISGYTEDEKIHIAQRHLLNKQIEANGLKKDEIELPAKTLQAIIRYYTREAGVRNLEREISKTCRKVVKNILTDKRLKKVCVTENNLEEYLGVKQYRYGTADEVDRVGQVTGLAWTEVGGELLKIEASAVKGKGKITLTGQLGDVMQESIQAAITVVRARAKAYNIPSKYFDNYDIHIHLPEGAIPKDGPSAGIGMCTALLSIMTNNPVRADLAMTGEITLRGEILPIGGLKEKLLAALRGGIQEVLIPEENVKDLKEIPDNVKKDLKIYPVSWIEEVLKVAFAKPTKKKVVKKKSTATKKAKKPATKRIVKKKTTPSRTRTTKSSKGTKKKKS